MEIHEAAGNPAEALRAFEELRSLLREELGTTPGPAAMAVHERAAARRAAPRRRAPRRRAAGPAAPPGRRRWRRALERHALVGPRATSSTALDALLAEAARRRSARLVLLAGDAGIGKTRLAAELARARARAPAPSSSTGASTRRRSPPYQPLVEMLRGWSAGALAGARCASALGARAAELGVLLPEFGRRPRDQPDALRGARAARRPASTASSTPSPRCSAEIGADAPLRARVRRPALGRPPDAAARCATSCARPQPRRALFLGTYRERRVSEPPPAARADRPTLRREGTLRRVELAGSREPEVARAGRGARRAAPAPSFVHALHGETEGNPFFIEEVVRHLRDSAGELGDDVDARRGGRAGRRARGHRAAPAAAERARARGAAGRLA